MFIHIPVILWKWKLNKMRRSEQTVWSRLSLGESGNFHGSSTEQNVLSNFTPFVCFTLEIQVWSTTFFPEDSGQTED